MASPTFLSDCGDSTGDLSEFAGVSGTVSVSTARPVTGTRSLEMDSGGGSAAYIITAADPAGTFPLQGAGNAGSRRGSSYHEFDAYPTTSAAIIRDHSGAFFEVRLISTGTLQLVTNQTASPVTLKTSTATVSLNTPTRISWAYTTVTTSNFTFKVWIGGVLAFTATQADGTLGDVGGYNLDYGWFSNPGASKKTWVDNIWVENDATLTDPGDVRCAKCRPNATGAANAFDTTVGGLTNRWDYVTSLPVETSAYLQHAGIAQAAENFGLDTSEVPGGATILGWRGWAYVKKGSAVAAPSVVSGFINNSTAAGATLAVTISGVQNGDSLIVLAANGIAGTTGWSCSDNGTNGASGNWTADLAPTKATGTLAMAVYSRHNIQDASKPTSVTVTFNATGERAVKVLLVRSLATSSVRDVATAVNNFTTSATTTTTSSGTLSQASEIVFGLYSWLGTAAADTFTANTGWTAAPGGNAGTTSSGVDTVVNAVYQVTTGTGSIQPSANITSGAAGLGVTISYKGLEASTDVSRLTIDGTDYAVGAFSTSPTQVWKHVAASALPTSSAAIGVKSTSTNEDTYLYDCGIVVAYTPALSGDITVTLGVGSLAVSAQGETVLTDAATTLGAQAVTANSQAPLAGAGVTTQPAVISITASPLTPTVQTSAAFTASALSVAASVQAETVAAEFNVSTTLPPLGITATAQALTVSASVLQALAALTATASPQAPAVTGQVLHTLSALSALASAQTPVLSGSVAYIPTTLSLVGSSPALTPIGDASHSPGPLLIVATAQPVTIVTDANTVQTLFALTASLPAPVVTSESLHTLSPQSVTAAAQPLTVAGDALYVSGALPLTISIQPGTISAGGNVTQSVGAFSLTAAAQALVAKADASLSLPVLPLAAAVEPLTVNAATTQALAAQVLLSSAQTVSTVGNTVATTAAASLVTASQAPSVSAESLLALSPLALTLEIAGAEVVYHASVGLMALNVTATLPGLTVRIVVAVRSSLSYSLSQRVSLRPSLVTHTLLSASTSRQTSLAVGHSAGVVLADSVSQRTRLSWSLNGD